MGDVRVISVDLDHECKEQINYMAHKTFLLPLLLAVQTTLTPPAMADGVKGCQPEADLTEQQVKAIKELAGGETGYQHLMQWAGNNLPASEVARFDAIVECGNIGNIVNAVVQVQAIHQLQTTRDKQMTDLEIVQLLKF